MKTILTTITLLLCITMNSQNLIIDGDMTLGSNCGNTIQEITYSGDLNFNGNYTLTLKNVKLTINGNINGIGIITNHCSNSPSQICYNGFNNAGNNITYQNITLVNCNTLYTPTFDVLKDYGYEYTIYNLLGQKLKYGFTNNSMFDGLPKNEVIIINVKGFEEIKTIIN